jgi:hypothetical protein
MIVEFRISPMEGYWLLEIYEDGELVDEAPEAYAELHRAVGYASQMLQQYVGATASEGHHFLGRGPSSDVTEATIRVLTTEQY